MIPGRKNVDGNPFSNYRQSKKISSNFGSSKVAKTDHSICMEDESMPSSLLIPKSNTKTSLNPDSPTSALCTPLRFRQTDGSVDSGSSPRFQSTPQFESPHENGWNERGYGRSGLRSSFSTRNYPLDDNQVKRVHQEITSIYPGRFIPHDENDSPFLPYSDWLMNHEICLQAKLVAQKNRDVYFYYVSDAKPDTDELYERLTVEMKKFYKCYKVAEVQMEASRVKVGQFCVLCTVSEVAFDFNFKRGKILDVHEDGTADVACLDDLTYVNVEFAALFELHVKFTELPFRYAPVRFRAFKPLIQDIFDNIEEVRFQCISAVGEQVEEHNVLVVGFDTDAQQFVIDIVVRRDLGYCSLLSLVAAFLYGVPYRDEYEDEVWKHFEKFMCIITDS